MFLQTVLLAAFVEAVNGRIENENGENHICFRETLVLRSH